MKFPVAPSPLLQKKIFNIIDILRGVGSTTSYRAIPALLIFGRFLKSQAFTEQQAGNRAEQYDIAEAWLNPEVWLNIPFGLESQLSSEELHIISSELSENLRHLGKRDYQRLIHALHELGLWALSQAEFEGAFDFTLEQFSHQRYSGLNEWHTPADMVALIVSIYQLQSGMSVYNPLAGTASLVPFLDAGITYTGQEENPGIYNLAALRLIAHLRSPATLLLGKASQLWPCQEIDVVLATQPVFATRFNSMNGDGMPADVAFIYQVLQQLSPQGRAVMPVAHGFLWQNGAAYQRCRQQLVESGALEAVIELPAGLLLPHTSVRTALLLLNPARVDRTRILFLDAAPYTQRKGRQVTLDTAALLAALAQPVAANAQFIAPEDLRAQQYQLDAHRYLLSQPPAHNQVRLKDVAEPIRIRAERNGPTEGRLLRIRDLKSDSLDFVLTAEQVPVDQLNGRSLIPLAQDALLLALQGGRLKPTWYKHQPGQVVYLTPSGVIPLRLHEQVNLNYFIAELSSDFVQQQVRGLNIGSAMPALRKADLLQLFINLPSLEEQQDIVRHTSEQILKAQQQTAVAAQAAKAQKAESVQQFASLKHALGGPLLQLAEGLTLLELVITHTGKQNQILTLESLMHPDDPTVTVRHTLAALKQAQQFIATTLDRRDHRLVVEEYPLERVEIIGFLRALVEDTNATYRTFRTTFEGSHELLLSELPLMQPSSTAECWVMANKTLLHRAFQNILRNAHWHGFHDTASPENRVVIETFFGYSDEEAAPNLIIEVKNNGASFPMNFDPEQLFLLGEYVGDTGRSGIGGHEVRQIFTYFGGSVDAKSLSGNDGFNVAYFIELPLA